MITSEERTWYSEPRMACQLNSRRRKFIEASSVY
ncbi:hypothetical protein M6B38_271665 [Iris pallida]|uniref:Uncharacterized protein n=1 Tax=Iris pallida TaxID=29817 RepID=A0AAX6I7G7_IRIPA|nr:hypothetical protein M6B38_374950 [Iris pallida]KAJ6825945.1 hypothetical protein M6B38_374955 [Iris pallida]KAJ6830207.1 hypothetical protein M6B38_355350 [Iris pallida]KAJ6848988.1 hypothetical protein M6B38_271665 [Iris pallida]